MANNSVPDHVTFVWKNKLKSRDCFLATLNFIPLLKNQFKSLLKLLKPKGAKAFNEHYIIGTN